MTSRLFAALAAATILFTAPVAHADFGVGVKAGTLGLGLEGRWAPLPWLDLRAGANRYDYDHTGSQAGVEYDGELGLDSYFLTGNLRMPLSPFRFTVGAFSNGNELRLTSADTGGANFDIGGSSFSAEEVGTLNSRTSFEKTAPYVGVGFDFEIFGKVGLNLDFGVLWQGDPQVELYADGTAASLQIFQDALENERQQLEDDMSDYKAWPVLSLSFVYNF